MQGQIEITFEDEHMLAISKPTGLVVNTSKTSPEGTLQDWMEEKYPEAFKEKSESEFSDRGGIVHRLDKATSGILLLAKDEETFLGLQDQFKERTIGKEYVAIVFGEMKEELVEINAPMARNPKNRVKMAIVDGGRESSTAVERLDKKEYDNMWFSMLSVKPKTGRTHQIRVHLSAFGMPVVGDFLYAGEKMRLEGEKHFDRLMLHAHKITFLHPKTNEEMTLEAKLPESFKLA